MKKSDLSKKWSKYCNTDNLVDSMIALLNTYGHINTEHGVCVLLDTYFSQKEPLIKMFMTSKNYSGDMRIVIQKEFDREISLNEIRSFFCNYTERFHTDQILQRTDSEGKSFIDYLKTGRTSLSIKDLPSKTAQTQKKEKLGNFSYRSMATKESDSNFYCFERYIGFFNSFARPALINDCKFDNGPLLKKGTKTSRAFNSVCKHFGVDKFNPYVSVTERNGEHIERTIYPYDKLFAQYSDLVSDLKRKMNFVISLNPLDYLTMSFGVSWQSCHNIRNGGWKGGCLSYMLDNTSMITFVVDKNDDRPIHEIPKLYRQMYHYKNNLFVQNRLYPQGNDGATDLYEKFRNFIVEEFTDILHVSGKWSCEVGPDALQGHINSVGVHYKDYNHNRSCSIFYPTENTDDALNCIMTIGHSGICLRCGGEHTNSSYLTHPYRRECVPF